MTKDEVFFLAANALTYMNYSMEEHRVPGMTNTMPPA